jgi:hypothetical protein
MRVRYHLFETEQSRNPEEELAVYARAVDQADARLRDLRLEERGELGLAAAALAASVIATEVFPPLVAPLFIGGLFVGALGARAMWRRWDLLERLSGESDAHVIAEVRAFALREATMDRRRSFAALIRARLSDARLSGEFRVLAVADDLEALAVDLDDDDQALDPAAAVACMRLLSDVARSPLLNRELPTEDLRAGVLRIRCGFSRA